MFKIKKNDKVKIINGKDKGKIGKVLRINFADEKVFVEGANIIKRHTRSKGQNQPGGIIKKEGPINISNVKLVCPSCGKDTRVGFEVKEDQKTRVCKACGQQI
ncbi:MAG: 50S ribosomal protein L24 [Actinomycetota bacterium]|nr:50S ribosomal protein L24 [Actinomycetota bacterium]